MAKKAKKAKGQNHVGRNEVVAAAAKHAGMSQVDVLNALNAVLAVTKATVASGIEVRFSGFGSWRLAHRAARKAKVFAAGKVAKGQKRKQVVKTIPASTVARFRVSDKFLAK